MRGSVWLTVPVVALLAVGCSPRPKAASAPPATLAAAPTPAAPVEDKATVPPAAVVATASNPPEPAAVRYSRADYGAHERRLAALIANAETRDTSGETQYRADRGEAERRRCATRACVERSYAVEEAWMRRWEGSADVK